VQLGVKCVSFLTSPILIVLLIPFTENYGSVLRDCSRALGNNPQSLKAYYRSASALLALDRVEEALDCCGRCLAIDANNQGALTLRVKVAEAKSVKDKKQREKAARLKKEAEAKRALDLAFKERNLIVVPKPDGTSNPYEPRWDPESPSLSTLIIPVFFLYPQHATSDVISHFVESTTFSAHISTMFPPNSSSPDWDQGGEYTEDSLVVYAWTRRKRLLKVGKGMTLRDVMNASGGKEGQPRDGLELKDGCLTFVVLPKGEVEAKWVDDYKKNRNG